MCGRFSLHLTDLREVAAQFSVVESALEGWQPRFNIAPSQHAPVVIVRDGRRVIAPMRWGLVPPWTSTRTAEQPQPSFNARAETAASLPTFRDALRARRCVAPATGFYEWRHERGRVAAPFWIARDDGGLLAFAGLWQPPSARAPADLGTFAILTTQAAGPVAAIHHRMPVLLTAAHVDAWLAEPKGAAPQLLAEFARDMEVAERVQVRPVSPLVSSPAVDGPECLAPPPAPTLPRQLGLFGDG